ncbi:hypothetical protein BSLG_005674 [Batrachochytrium salamandrivorans]|nr:hypothetical protein BSLG_005674 [Batrachochytrium salamandrivorans]
MKLSSVLVGMLTFASFVVSTPIYTVVSYDGYKIYKVKIESDYEASLIREILEDIQLGVKSWNKAIKLVCQRWQPRSYCKEIFTDYQDQSVLVAFIASLPGVTQFSLGKHTEGRDITGFTFGTGSKNIVFNVLNPDGYAYSRSTDRMWRKIVGPTRTQTASADLTATSLSNGDLRKALLMNAQGLIVDRLLVRLQKPKHCNLVKASKVATTVPLRCSWGKVCQVDPPVPRSTQPMVIPLIIHSLGITYSFTFELRGGGHERF